MSRARAGSRRNIANWKTLYEAKAPKGLVVIGVPCNDFGAQEPGTAHEIRDFCDTNYHVKFPMTAKAEIVSPAKRNPFYAWVARELGDTALPKLEFPQIPDRQGWRNWSKGSAPRPPPLAPKSWPPSTRP